MTIDTDRMNELILAVTLRKKLTNLTAEEKEFVKELRADLRDMKKAASRWIFRARWPAKLSSTCPTLALSVLPNPPTIL